MTSSHNRNVRAATVLPARGPYVATIELCRWQLQALLWQVQEQVAAKPWDEYDRDEQLDWVDLERMALELALSLHMYMQLGESERRHRERWVGLRGIYGEAS